MISSVNAFSLKENNKADAKVGQVKAKDPDTKVATKDTLSYSIVSQKDASNADVTVFTMDPVTGSFKVPVAGALNYEASPSTRWWFA